MYPCRARRPAILGPVASGKEFPHDRSLHKKKGGPGSRRDPPDLSSSRYRRGLDRFLEVLGDPEGDLLGRLDLDRLAGRRVAAHARRTVAHLKDAEARDADLVALLEM